MLILKNLKFRLIFGNKRFKIFIPSCDFNNQKTVNGIGKVKLERLRVKVKLERFRVKRMILTLKVDY